VCAQEREIFDHYFQVVWIKISPHKPIFVECLKIILLLRDDEPYDVHEINESYVECRNDSYIVTKTPCSGTTVTVNEPLIN
jgi:hypothetical protein